MEMTLQLGAFGDEQINEQDLLARLAWLRDVIGPRLERFLGYYRNPTTALAASLSCGTGVSFAVRPFRQFQELGLPARITGFRRAADGAASSTGAVDVQRKEVVIENDIGWRINTMVDFVAGRMPNITSTAKDGAMRAKMTEVIEAILMAGGGVMLLQELVLQGAIAGSAWVRLCPTEELLARLTDVERSQKPEASSQKFEGIGHGQTQIDTDNEAPGEGNGGGGAGGEVEDRDITSVETSADVDAATLDVARWLRLKVVKTSRLCPLLEGDEGKEEGGRSGTVPGYAAVLIEPPGGGDTLKRELRATGLFERIRGWFGPIAAAGPKAEEFSFDLFGPTHWQRYVEGVLVEEGANALGVVPFVRYVNGQDVAAGTRVGPAGSRAVDVGEGEVEPLIGLQDELNTRLSDRAYRVTMTSFRMWLGRGIEDFTKRPIGPGQMWSTDNTAATIEGFGGDASAPSETQHIEEVREALDKISGVPPVAAGVLRQKLGNLTSAVALKVTLIALLARTDRKRSALTETLRRVVREVLELLDRAGVFKSAAEDRGIDVNWPSAMPESDMDRLTEAQTKLALGIKREVVLAELGYVNEEVETGVGDKVTG
ncbi:MAG: phage portal protein [Phycisphaerales bacterium]|nr:phage portal protein [Phycisphaerales bacterium]